MDNRVTIVYRKDVAAGPSRPAHIAGERLTVRNAVAAQKDHADAEIVSYADGRTFVAAQDPSLVAAAEAENAKAKPKPKPAKPDATDEKAS